MLLDLVNRISSERKVKKKLDIQVWVLWRSSRGRPESTSQGRPLNVRLRRPLDAISGRPLDVISGRPRDGQIGSLGDVLGTLEGDVLGTPWGPIFTDWGIGNELHYLIECKNKAITKTCSKFLKHFIMYGRASKNSHRKKSAKLFLHLKMMP